MVKQFIKCCKENNQSVCKGKHTRIAHVSPAFLNTRKARGDLSQLLKGNGSQPSVLYAAELSLKIGGEIKKISIHNNQAKSTRNS